LSRLFTITLIIASVCIAIATIGGVVWGNVLFARQESGGLDLLVPWSAARTFVEYGISPYDASASQRTQILYYGRVAAEGENPLQLSMPFPALLFFIPFALIKDFMIARAVWMVLLEVALATAAFFSLRLAGRRFPFLLFVLYVLFALLWFHAIFPLVSGSSVIFTLLFLTGGLQALRDGKDELSGILFALLIFFPRSSGIFLVFILWWLIRQHRWRVLGGAGMATGLLLLLSFLLVPGWVGEFFWSALSQWKFVVSYSTFSLLSDWSPGIGSQLAWLTTIVVVILFFAEWYASRDGDWRQFTWAASITLALTPFLGLPASPADYVVMLLPLTLVLTVMSERWSPRHWGLGILWLIILFAGQWGGVWALLTTGNPDSLPVFLFIAVPLLCFFGLYWVRWWAIRPPRTWIDQIKRIP